MQFPARLAVCALLLALAAPLSAQSATSDAALTTREAAPIATPATAAQSSQSSQFSSDVALTIVAPAAEPQAAARAPMTDDRVAVHAPEHARSDAAATAAAAHANLGQARALMVVGVAGLLVGAIIGGTPGTIIMIGGAVIGLKGLYDYLQ